MTAIEPGRGGRSDGGSRASSPLNKQVPVALSINLCSLDDENDREPRAEVIIQRVVWDGRQMEALRRRRRRRRRKGEEVR